MKLNATLLKSTVVAALGGLLFGFDTAVISGTTGALTQTYSLYAISFGSDRVQRALRHGPGRDAGRVSG